MCGFHDLPHRRPDSTVDTAKMNAQGDASATPNLFEALARDTHHAVVAIDRHQTIVSFSTTAERMFGYAADAVIGQPLDMLLPEASRDQHRAYVNQVLETHETARDMGRDGRVQGRRKDGTIFPVEASILRLDIANDPVLVAVLSDLTEVENRERENRWLTELLRVTPDFVGIAGPDERILFQNAAANRMLGLPEDAEIGSMEINQMHPQWSYEKLQTEAFPTAARTGRWESEIAFLSRSGEEVPVSQQILAHYDDHGEVVRWSTIARDLRPYRQLESHGHRLAHALEEVEDPVWIFDANGQFEYANQPFTRLTGVNGRDLAQWNAFTLFELLPEADADESLPNFRQAVSAGERFRALLTLAPHEEEVFIEATVGPVVDTSGRLDYCVAIGRDVTARIQREERLHELAYVDQVAEVYRRSYAIEYLNEAIQEADAHLAVLFIDLDRFKPINDRFGHAVGDSLLAMIGARLQHSVRAGDVVARFGGDEFVVIARMHNEARGSQRLAKKVQQALVSPFYLEGGQFHIRASIGVATYPTHGETADALLERADAAMYEAKATGGGVRFAVDTTPVEPDRTATEQAPQQRDKNRRP
jgi:diguanylate cyclase (GGDEF)-like protein/PAS domain S-box-containing protein